MGQEDFAAAAENKGLLFFYSPHAAIASTVGGGGGRSREAADIPAGFLEPPNRSSELKGVFL